jgi:HKD family nuclease
MNIFVQHKNRPSQVLFAFDDVIHPTVSEVRWAVAYSTLRGCTRLTKRIADRMGEQKWKDTQKSFITSVDFGLTEPAALEFLADQPHSRVYVANPEVHARPGFRPSQAYHPKLFLFDRPAVTGYVVGSANLTASALLSNTEVVSTGLEAPAASSWNSVWNELLRDAAPLTTALLESYRLKWSKPAPRPVEPDPPQPPPTIRPASQPVFWDAITTGGVLPATFAHFWVEAGSMSSGGSHNQLELPRGANRFFGFTHGVYGSEHITIGHPTLTLRGRSWTDRPLTWHGNNKMERMNLPTQSQGGFDYRHTAVLFRRHAGGFEIDVSPWDDDAAIAWRTASEALGKVFRLGERGPRICGLF